MEAWKGECVSSAYTISFTPAMLVDRDRQSNFLDMTKWMLWMVISTYFNGIQNPFWHWKYTFTLHKFDDFPHLIFFESGIFDTCIFFQYSICSVQKQFSQAECLSVWKPFIKRILLLIPETKLTYDMSSDSSRLYLSVSLKKSFPWNNFGKVEI